VEPGRVTETASQPAREARSPLEIGSLVTLAALAFAAVVGVIAVIDSDSRPAGFGVGIGIALLIFLAGATIACALACLARRRMEIVALDAIVISCLAVDLVVLAVWLDIETEAYGKVVGVAFVWSLLALVILGLVLAVPTPERVARALYVGAVTAAIAGGLISTWLIATAESDDSVGVADGGTSFSGPLPIGDDALLQVLGVMLVLLAAFWFCTLAASRLPDQTLKRTLTTSPSSTT
jgi:hypothetical protein